MIVISNVFQITFVMSGGYPDMLGGYPDMSVAYLDMSGGYSDMLGKNLRGQGRTEG